MLGSPSFQRLNAYLYYALPIAVILLYDMYPSSQPLNTYLPYALPIDSIALHYFILMRALLKMTHVFLFPHCCIVSVINLYAFLGAKGNLQIILSFRPLCQLAH